MKFADLLASLERQLAGVEAQRAGLVTEQTALLDSVDERSSLSDVDQARFDEISAQKTKLGVDIAALREKVDTTKREMADDEQAQRDAGDITRRLDSSPARVTSEARTYTVETARDGVSFFADFYRSQFKGDFNARERLERHAREVVVEQERAIGSGNVGGLLVPAYLPEQLVLPTRKGRVYAEQVTNLALPESGQTLSIPRWTSGTTVTSQDGENTQVSNTNVVADTDLVVNVRTIAGEQDVSRQTLERVGADVDLIIYADLVEAYHAQLGWQVINGTGLNAQHLGVRNTAGIPSSTAFGAALSAALFYRKIAGAIASVASGERAANEAPLEANLITMHPRRWAWLTSLVDNDGRPLVNTAWNGPTNVHGLNLNPGKQSLTEGEGTRVVGQIHGLPVVTDAQIPTNVGTLNEDIVLVSDTSKSLLWEDGDGAPRELQFDQTNSNLLQIKLQVYGYSAFTAGRRPNATAIVGGKDATAGNGLIAPVLF